MNKNIPVVLIAVLAAGCSSNLREEDYAPPMNTARLISIQDCSQAINTGGGNLLCREPTAAERRAKLAEEERQAKAKREAEARAERERLERERAEQLAREEAARKARLAEEERLAAERRRADAAAAAAAAAERERLAKLEAERLARERAEQEKREAAARECRRLEQERSDGRAMLADFVSKYGKAEEFKAIAGQISAFLDKAAKPKPCPPA
jgi:hypothetical protein